MSNTVLTIGTFDLFHSGHVDLLFKCKRLAETGKVIVGLNTDEFVEKYKGERPTISFSDRRRVLSTSMFVDDVFPNDQEDGDIRPLLRKVRTAYPHAGRIILAAGTDWANREYDKQIGIDALELAALQDVNLVFLPRPVDGLSTSEVKAKLVAPFLPVPQPEPTHWDWGANND